MSSTPRTIRRAKARRGGHRDGFPIGHSDKHSRSHAGRHGVGHTRPLPGSVVSKPITGIMIAGQSNAHGRASPTLLDPGVNGTAIYSNATIDTADSFSWPSSVVPRRDLQPFGSGVPGMGCELSLGRFAIDALLADAVLPMSKMGVDGSLIATWRNSTNLNNFNTYWNTQESDTGKVISDLVWIQGEADAINSTLSGLYESELTALMNSIVAAHPGLKRIYIVRLNVNATGAAITPADRAVVRTAQANWVAAHPGLGYLVDVDGIQLDPSDMVHYLANSYWAMGQAIGMAMLGACGMTLPTERAGTNPYIRQLFRAPMFHTSTVSDAAFMPTPSVANVGDWQYIFIGPNVQAAAVTVVDAQGFTKLGSTVDSNAGGVHMIMEVYRRQYNGSQGSPIFNTGSGQNRRGGFGVTVHRGGDADANQDHVTNANVLAMNATAVNTTVNGSLVVLFHAGFSSTDSPLTGVTAAGLSNVVVVQESRISNSCKLTVIAGTDDVAGSSLAITGTHPVNTNQADKMVSIPPG